VLACAPPTGEIVDRTTVEGVEKVKFTDVAVPAEFADMTA
jgi:hypothetical protein